MEINAKDVMRLRAETDAPVMESRAALQEAGGDFEKAKAILREKGKAAAAKRQDRATSEGVAALSTAENHQAVGGVVLECETDFVARNEDFIALAQRLAEVFLHNAPGADPLSVKTGEHTVGGLIEDAIGTIRENIKLTKAVHLKTDNKFATYVHHDRKKAVVIELAGDAANGHDVGREIAIQSVAFPPEFISKDQVPQAYIDKELEIETQRAINEGKAPDIAKNIAMGRINKEYMKRVVLLEQPFFRDNSKSVEQYMAEEAKSGGGAIKIVGITRLAVGEGDSEGA